MNKPNKAELEYFIRYSLDSDKYKRYMELYEEIERLNNELENVKAHYETEAEAKYYEFIDNHESELQQRINKANDILKDYLCSYDYTSAEFKKIAEVFMDLLNTLKGTDLTKNDKNQIRWSKEEFKVGVDKEQCQDLKS